MQDAQLVGEGSYPGGVDTTHAIVDIYNGLSADAQKVLAEVIRIERKYLHLGRPHGVANEIVVAVEKSIR